MHRRARHLNARHAGAGLVLDARRISGMNDGDAVSTWSDVSGNGFNATQSTSGNKPIYRTRYLAGNPGVSFSSASSQWLTCGNVLNVGTQSLFIISVAKMSGGLESIVAKAIAAGQNGRWAIGLLDAVLGTILVWDQPSGVYLPRAAANVTTNAVFSTSANRTSTNFSMHINGVSGPNVTVPNNGGNLNTTDRLLIGAYGNSTDTGQVNYLNGYVCSVAVIVNTISISLFYRLRHSAAFSFKIQCS